MLSLLWIGFFVVAFFVAFMRAALGEPQVFSDMSQALFDSARQSIDIGLSLAGMMMFWMGLMKIAEEAGIMRRLANALSPLLRWLMPSIPEGHPALGSIALNIAANMLGIDNAATPMGLKAMQQLQELNPSKNTASDAQIMFMVINTASLTLLPVSVFMFRAQAGSAHPAIVFLPLLLTSLAALISGVLLCLFTQRHSRTHLSMNGKVLFIIPALIALVFLIAKSRLLQHPEFSSFLGNLLLFGFALWFLLAGAVKRLPVFELFIEGAKEGLQTLLRILPYLVAMLVAIGVFRASGALDLIINAISLLVTALHLPTDFLPALPTALLKSFSGSGARALMIDTMKHYGPDSFAGLLSSIFQGSSEVIFYVLTVYFGSIGITRFRQALWIALFADGVAIVTGIILGYWFFHA